MTTWDLFEDLRSAQDELLRMNRPTAKAAEPGTGSIPAWVPGPVAAAWSFLI
jgi:hypothetical protein